MDGWDRGKPRVTAPSSRDIVLPRNRSSGVFRGAMSAPTTPPANATTPPPPTPSAPPPSAPAARAPPRRRPPPRPSRRPRPPPRPRPRRPRPPPPRRRPPRPRPPPPPSTGAGPPSSSHAAHEVVAQEHNHPRDEAEWEEHGGRKRKPQRLRRRQRAATDDPIQLLRRLPAHRLGRRGGCDHIGEERALRVGPRRRRTGTVESYWASPRKGRAPGRIGAERRRWGREQWSDSSSTEAIAAAEMYSRTATAASEAYWPVIESLSG